MENPNRLEKSFRYDNWANQECLKSIIACDSPPHRVREIIAHIVGAQLLWMSRLNLPVSKTAVWPSLTLEQCDHELVQISQRWQDFLGKTEPEGLTQEVAYVNSKGEPWQNSVLDILNHVLIHSSYHRGQVATLLGQSGFLPAYTDYIHCIRQKLVDQ